MLKIRTTLQGEVAALEADLRKATMKAGKLAAQLRTCTDAAVRSRREARHQELCTERDKIHERLRAAQGRLRAASKCEHQHTHTMPGLMTSRTSTHGKVRMMQTGEVVRFARHGQLAEATCGPVAVTLILEDDGTMHVLSVENEHPILEFWGTVESLKLERGFGIVRTHGGTLINGTETVLFHLADLNGRDGGASGCVPKEALSEGMVVSFRVDVKTDDAAQWVAVALREVRPDPVPAPVWPQGMAWGWEGASGGVDWSSNPYEATSEW